MLLTIKKICYPTFVLGLVLPRKCGAIVTMRRAITIPIFPDDLTRFKVSNNDSGCVISMNLAGRG